MSTQEIKVGLGERSYTIQVGKNSLEMLRDTIHHLSLQHASCLIVSDSHVAPHYLDPVLTQLPHAGHVVVPAGEPSKSHECLIQIYEAALAHKLDRKGVIIALGGGVVGDLAGYAAATYLRGVPYIQCPTSLLAMVDSSVGGKTGINLPQGKNLIGCFHQPLAVLADLSSLKTLPSRELRSGLAEVVKYGMIWDPNLFNYLQENIEPLLALDEVALSHIVTQSCLIKASVVEQDEREGGLRAILNFGHTLGHAIENVAGYGHWLHGEAIAMGMVFASNLSEQQLGFSHQQTKALVQLLQNIGLPVSKPELQLDKLREAMALDKKVALQKPRWVLAEHIGKVRFGEEVPEKNIQTTWERWA